MRKLLVLLSTLVILATPASAGWAVFGVIQADTDSSLTIDSTRFFMPGGEELTYPTVGWHAEPGALDTFVFPDLPEWPGLIMSFAWIGTLPVIQPIPEPVSDSWYSFQPPFEQAKQMFHGVLGIQELPGPVQAQPVPILPGVLTNQALNNLASNRQIEIINPLGQTVRTLP
ncbi:MAG: hypothetical protein ACUVUR_00650, partial [bacterium]